MLDLASMTNEDFCTPITPPVTRASSQIVIDASGTVSLSSKLAEKFSKKPVHLRFNENRTAIQISYAGTEADPLSIVFPKSGRKLLPSAQALLKQKRIALPAIFRSYEPLDSDKWRGAHMQNPTPSSSPTSHSKKKK